MQNQFVAAGAGVAGVGCACCGQTIVQGDMITDRKVMKGGELAYIELLHQGCSTARAVAIQEDTNSTWVVIGRDETLAVKKSAMDALAFVKRRDADLSAAAGRNVVTVVSWHTISDIGARIVRAVAGLR